MNLDSWEEMMAAVFSPPLLEDGAETNFSKMAAAYDEMSVIERVNLFEAMEKAGFHGQKEFEEMEQSVDHIRSSLTIAVHRAMEELEKCPS